MQRPSFSSGWSLGESSYQLLRDDLSEIDMRSMVEFGAGTSTAHLAIDFPDAQIWSREHHAQYAEETRKSLREARHVHVSTCPLTWQLHGGALFLSYAPGPLPQEVDAVLVDGPPFWTRRGREACLYQVHSVLRIGGRIYLDDYRRDAEQQIVRNWLQAFGSSIRVLKEFDSDHRICVLEKVSDTVLPKATFGRSIDSARSSALYFASRLRGNLP